MTDNDNPTIDNTTDLMAGLELKTERMLAEIDAEGVGWITFNNPARHNAISLEMWQGLGDILAYFQSHDAVRVIVMKGAGDAAFVSGADISEFDDKRGSAEAKASYGEIAAYGSRWLARIEKPLIAMISGYCIGGGLAIALQADLRFAATGSRFGIPAARLGLGYEYPGIAQLARLVGPSCARDILFSARFMDTEEAFRIGLINQRYAPEVLHDEVRSYVARVAANAPLTVRAAKAAINAFEKDADKRDLAAVDAQVNQCFDSDDYREGRRAFAEKRSPNFTGR